MERKAYESLALDEDDQYAGLDSLAEKIWQRYQLRVSGSKESLGRVGLPPFEDIKKKVLTRLLTGDEMSPELAAMLRTKMHIPNPAPSTTGDTNLPAAAAEA